MLLDLPGIIFFVLRSMRPLSSPSESEPPMSSVSVIFGRRFYEREREHIGKKER
jgi:hypothetical protein